MDVKEFPLSENIEKVGYTTEINFHKRNSKNLASVNSSLSSKRRRNFQLSTSYENKDVFEEKVKIPFPNEKI